jgi:hypothetical protein
MHEQTYSSHSSKSDLDIGNHQLRMEQNVNRKIIYPKNIALLLALGLIFLSLSIAMKGSSKESTSRSTLKLSSYEWVLKAYDRTDKEAFHTWQADENLELEEFIDIQAPKISYRASILGNTQLPSGIDSSKILKIQCGKINTFEAEFSKHNPPLNFVIHQRCGNRLWVLKLKLL